MDRYEKNGKYAKFLKMKAMLFHSAIYQTINASYACLADTMKLSYEDTSWGSFLI